MSPSFDHRTNDDGSNELSDQRQAIAVRYLIHESIEVPMAEFDIAVYGSTSGAVAAAIQAARLGRKTVLVSPDEHIGGIQIEGLGSTDIDNQVEFQNSTAVGGLALELHRRLSAHYGRLDQLEDVIAKRLKVPEVWKFESSVLERILAAWLAEYPSLVVVREGLVEEPSAVSKTGSMVTSIQLTNGQFISARYFIEASYEGDLLAAAGITTTIGREPSSQYNESLAGVRDDTRYTQFDVPVDPYRIPRDPSSGLLSGISPEPFGEPGDGDRHLQAYSYRLPLTDIEGNKLPIYKPEGYDESHYELHRRYIQAGGKLYTPRLKGVPNRKTDLIGSEGVLATDLLGMNDDWPTANRTRREEILDETARFTKGLIWFFANDPVVPPEIRSVWSNFGYCLDEFPDNNHFPRRLYVRDARRMVSDYVITQHTASEHDGEGPDPYPIAVAYWPTDTHCARRVVRKGLAHNEGFVFKEKKHEWRPFGISYRALVPKRSEGTNILTATCPSSSHVGYGAVRLEHQFYALGQACANACDIALAGSVSLDVQDVPYPALKERLLEQGAVLDASLVGKPDFSLLHR
ncbi:FAD dependent oxidoreductase-domain-containing protein [Aspergillus lucknowensis]|uniref:FAD dependent oxidoreductase-domain-containing protein n=1 Tax=Aspergillus lucknowensis TaxID=176173 RepID=A0ABR4LFA6_9EURO